MDSRRRKTSSRTGADAHGRIVRTALTVNVEALFLTPETPSGLESRCSLLLDTALRCEINREAAEPMPAFVMRAGDRCESGAPMRVSRRRERVPA